MDGRELGAVRKGNEETEEVARVVGHHLFVTVMRACGSKSPASFLDDSALISKTTYSYWANLRVCELQSALSAKR